MAKQITVRGVSAVLSDKLDELARQKGQSVNATVIEVLEKALGVREREEQLKRFATWSKQDVEEFDLLIREQRVIDDDLWK